LTAFRIRIVQCKDIAFSSYHALCLGWYPLWIMLMVLYIYYYYYYHHHYY
jgi:hypothetical protein